MSPNKSHFCGENQGDHVHQHLIFLYFFAKKKITLKEKADPALVSAVLTRHRVLKNTPVRPLIVCLSSKYYKKIIYPVEGKLGRKLIFFC